MPILATQRLQPTSYLNLPPVMAQQGLQQGPKRQTPNDAGRTARSMLEFVDISCERRDRTSRFSPTWLAKPACEPN